MSTRTLVPAAHPLSGSVTVPGDKSLSHRAVLFAAMAEGVSHLSGVLDSADVRSTMSAVRALGATVERLDTDPEGMGLRVTGWGETGPRQPDAPIDCGNSGTTARLLMGVLAGWPGRTFTLTGDQSLSARPMRRVIDPLLEMGADITSAEEGTLPVVVRGTELRGIEYTLPVASAQVKSAVLLAGLRAEGATIVHEPLPSRDHTERLLPAFGVEVPCTESPRSCRIEGVSRLAAARVAVPGDPSSAAFLVGAALIVPDSDVTITGVGLNPTRIGFLRVLERMGADIRLVPRPGEHGAEPVGDIVVRFTALDGTLIVPAEVPSLVDEVPLLAVVATQAFGRTRFAGVGELRVKESDRLGALAEALKTLGAPVDSGRDWLEVEGPSRLHGAWLDSRGDHRLAMAYAVAALIADAPLTVGDFDSIAVSFPRFTEVLASLMVS